MPTPSIGLVGCGRIGRCLVRLLAHHERLRLALVEEPAEPEAVEYLLRFDSLLGRFPGQLSRDEGSLTIDGRRVELRAPADDAVPPWGELGIDLVVEASGRERHRDELERHLAAGVTDGQLDRSHRIVSMGSVTANAAGPVLRVLSRALGVDRAFVSSVHAYTSQLRLADVPAPDMRSGRAAAENIIPQPTNADEVLAELLPELAGRISGLALHVPVPNGSLVDLTCWHPRTVTAEELNGAMAAACAGELAGIVAYETQPIVSSDILMTTHSGVFDSLSTQIVAGRVSKTLTFYDNAWGYAHRVVELLGRLAAFETGSPA